LSIYYLPIPKLWQMECSSTARVRLFASWAECTIHIYDALYIWLHTSYGAHHFAYYYIASLCILLHRVMLVYYTTATIDSMRPCVECTTQIWCLYNAPYMYIFLWCTTHMASYCLQSLYTYGVATISRLLKIIGLFCKRAL